MRPILDFQLTFQGFFRHGEVINPFNITAVHPLSRARSCLLLASVLCVALASCGPSDQPESPLTNAHQEPAVRKAEIAFEAIGLEWETNEDAWPTEQFHEAATEQLHQLKAFLKGDSEPVSSLFAQPVAIGALRPDPLQTVFDDQQFLIQRGIPNGPLEKDPQLLRGLITGYERETLTLEFKIFDVQMTADGATTKIAASWSGRTSKGRLQESATWRCGWVLGGPPRLQSIRVESYESSLAKSAPNTLAFNDCTEAVFNEVPAYEDQLAYDIDHWVKRIEAAFGINVSGWEGIAIGDANGDGLDDVYVCQPGGLPNRLFIHKPDGTVFDASSFAGVDWRIQTQSALFVDLDNDDDQDLAIATTLGVIIMANDGRGTFTVKASDLIPEAAPMSLSAADFDLDGDLDLYATCYSKRRASITSTVLGRPMPYHDANNGGRNVLLRNDREWKFTNATLETGLDANNRRFSFAASWEDYDNDGDLDLYVANDYGRNNLYRNDRSDDGSHTFTDVAKVAGVEDISAGMSVSWGDYDLDGRTDLYVSNMWSSAGNRVAFQRQFQTSADTATLEAMRRHARGNSLFRNRGDGTFEDVSESMGVTMGRWAWGSRFVDWNSDGWQDLVVANGFITQPEDTGDL